MKLKGRVESFCERGVGDVVVSRANSAGCDDEVVGRRQPASTVDDGCAIVGDGFDTLKSDSTREKEFCEKGGVGIHRFAIKDFVANYEAGGGAEGARLDGHGERGFGGEVAGEGGEAGEHRVGKEKEGEKGRGREERGSEGPEVFRR